MWKRYKIGDSVVVARRFRSVPRSCPSLLSGLGNFFLFPLPLLAGKRAEVQKLTGEQDGEDVALLAQLRLPRETSAKSSPPDKRILFPAPQSLPCPPVDRTDGPSSQYSGTYS